MLAPVQNGRCDITLGKRFERSQDIPRDKYIMLKAAIIFQFFTTGMWLSDAHNGFRAMNRDAAEQLHIEQDRMGHATEIIEYIKRYDLEYEEVPVTITYDEDIEGQRLLNAINIAGQNLYHKFFR
jgi:hypothetical protein